MKKRLLAMFLALALCVGLCVPAYAVDVKNAAQEDIKSTFTILRNGTIDETQGRYRSSQPILVDDNSDGVMEEIYYEVFDRTDSWTITNTGSKAVSASGRTDYEISFVTWQYGYAPDQGFEWVGGTSEVTQDGRIVHILDGGDRRAVLKAGESITIPAGSFEWEDEEYRSPYDGTGAVHAMSILIDYGTQTDPEAGYLTYTLYFRADAGQKAAIDKKQDSPAPAFIDVPAWCSGAVDWAVAQKITNGKGGGKFAPGDPCTNAEILTFLWRAAGEPKEGIKTPIANTQESDFFYDAAQWASGRGMIDPVTFDPSKPCTRGSAMIYIWNAFDEMGVGGSDIFSDVPSGNEALYGAVNYALACGITNGYPDGTFRPNNTCTRGEIVTFLHRAYVPEASLSFNF